ncbi:hypothetical protein Mapa_013752 [Marchantia paleacea]|nr:hypothetical protein Mapa_013752 [Marchantia paleacea]
MEQSLWNRGYSRVVRCASYRIYHQRSRKSWCNAKHIISQARGLQAKNSTSNDSFASQRIVEFFSGAPGTKLSYS